MTMLGFAYILFAAIAFAIAWLWHDLRLIFERHKMLRNVVDSHEEDANRRLDAQLKRIRDLEERERSAMRSIAATAARETEVSTPYTFTGFHLGTGNTPPRPFEVVRASDGVFVTGPGFATMDEAVKVAEELARTYPTETFKVYGVIAEIKADVPVTRVDYLTPVKHD